jgi:hypothetical protein
VVRAEVPARDRASCYISRREANTSALSERTLTARRCEDVEESRKREPSS